MPKAYVQYLRKDNAKITEEIEYNGSRNNLLTETSKRLPNCAIPGQLSVSFPDSSIMDIVFKITKRGTYKENGVTYPSMYIPTVILSDRVKHMPEGEPYTKRYLSCIHPESNNYKAYIIEPQQDKILCKYGSIDDVANGKVRTVTYEKDLFWVRYYEKLSKGYQDNSKIFFSEETQDDNASKQNTFPHKLYEELYQYAHNMVNTVLSESMKITKRQIEECRKIWNELGQESTVEGFNKKLENLMVLSPRIRRPLQDQVSEYLATTTNDFTRIIQFEDNLISAMEGTYYASHNGKSLATAESDGLPIIVEAYAGMKDYILSTLPKEIADRVESVYKIIDPKRQQVFDLYCHENHITNIQQLWHGSRNENWLSIIKNGLQLNPNAKITGKMFGDGIYFAPNPKKSYGYTSCTGSYWAKGTMPVGYMGLYDTAVGDPYYPTTYGSGVKNSMTANHKNCVYAKKGGALGLYNDEVVFYDEAAVSLAYIVKIKA